MLVELLYGYLSGSLALTADGWHMGSHAVALGLAVFAYQFARKHAANRRFTFGTGKVSPLAAYTSALVLMGIAASMIWQAIERLMAPIPVQFNEALVVACIGLAFNLVSAMMLNPNNHEHEHDHGHDHNLRAAYVHVLADALTSMLAIVALAGGKWYGWGWLDPAVGLLGALIIVRWAWRLMHSTAEVLLDAEDTDALEAEVKKRIEAEHGNHVVAIHVWRTDPRAFACMISIRSSLARTPAHYKALLTGVTGIGHLTVEVAGSEAPRT